MSDHAREEELERLRAGHAALLEALKEARKYLVIEGYIARVTKAEHAVIRQIDAALAFAEGPQKKEGAR